MTKKINYFDTPDNERKYGKIGFRIIKSITKPND